MPGSPSDPPSPPLRGKPTRHSRDQTRKERLAAALRANLKRRKVRQYRKPAKGPPEDKPPRDGPEGTEIPAAARTKERD